MTYYDTTHVAEKQRRDYASATSYQDFVVMEFFRQNPGQHSPSEVWERVLSDAPLTSVRRSITSLTSSGRLEKTNVKVPGIYGRPEHLWTLAK